MGSTTKIDRSDLGLLLADFEGMVVAPQDDSAKCYAQYRIRDER